MSITASFNSFTLLNRNDPGDTPLSAVGKGKPKDRDDEPKSIAYRKPAGLAAAGPTKKPDPAADKKEPEAVAVVPLPPSFDDPAHFPTLGNRKPQAVEAEKAGTEPLRGRQE
ncbi:hypothetical protein E2562_021321 [Oryza meyeriana var. granulata]|uniref:Uncharacterized protein n=1 Tax=Oryza meyeriana var. granulata TaxID=110450 RepID=A0A6G1BYP4_9ORYZ|nr:hypothetical protein E2562_021321 [Oryza meyeriana var. granulata]